MSGNSLANKLLKQHKVTGIKKTVGNMIEQYETYKNVDVIAGAIYKVGEHILITDTLANLFSYVGTSLPLKDVKGYKIMEPAYLSVFKETNNKLIVCSPVPLFTKQMMGKAKDFGLVIKRIF